MCRGCVESHSFPGSRLGVPWFFLFGSNYSITKLLFPSWIPLKLVRSKSFSQDENEQQLTMHVRKNLLLLVEEASRQNMRRRKARQAAFQEAMMTMQASLVFQVE